MPLSLAKMRFEDYFKEKKLGDSTMKFFLDTAIISDIKKAANLGIIDGVTTNPSLIAQSGRALGEVIREIVEIVDGPISAEVIATEREGMIEEGRQLAKIHPNIVIKLPLTPAGVSACKWFSENKIKTNMTLVFSSNQALLAAKAGASYVSPFIGRLDDIGHDGMALIKEIRQVFDNYKFSTEILAASIRNSSHVRLCAISGADVATMPLAVIESLYKHTLTDKGLDAFLKDHAKANSK